MAHPAALSGLRIAGETCIDCEGCTGACIAMGEAGLTIGEIARLVLAGEHDDRVLAAVSRCGLCGLCSVHCPVDLDTRRVMGRARHVLTDCGALAYEGSECLHVDCDQTIFTAYRSVYGISYDDLVPAEFDTVFFPGCILASYAPDLTRAVYDWLAGQGIAVALSDLCCGSPLVSLGLGDRARRLRQYLGETFEEAGVKRVVTVCPGCHAELLSDLANMELVPLPVLMHEAGLQHCGDDVISVHDSCKDRMGPFGPAVRSIMGGHPRLEMEHHGLNTICCGSGGMVSSVDPALYAERGRARLQEFHSTGAERLITSCVTCGYALSAQSQPGEVLHYLELLFGTRIDWGQVRMNQQAMWDGERGLIAAGLLEQARCFTGWELSGPASLAGQEVAS